ncbi:hypothetical protein CMI37_08545 [Candidatus Pacearchaeota archaeon]|nr:hypothetical protein [Candidatus Pacearchaeota archaeon]
MGSVKISNMLVWVKNNMVLGRQDYQGRHEFIAYGWYGQHKWYGDRKQTTVLEYNKPLKSELHPTQKPIELIEGCLNNSSLLKHVILDIFGGSGSTLIACEKLDRKCYMMEIDPHYCDVIIKRWEDFTGEKAVKCNGN